MRRKEVQTSLFGGIVSPSTPTAASESSARESLSSTSGSRSRSRGEVESWRCFGLGKWRDKFPWIDVREDGIYCSRCAEFKPASKTRACGGSSTFISSAYVGNRPDVLQRHEKSVFHSEANKKFQESVARRSKRRHIDDYVDQRQQLTIDGEGMCDAFKCLYWLAKNEIAHTTHFQSLRQLCMDLGNEFLKRLTKARNKTYASEQSMQEMLAAISRSLEMSLVKAVAESPYYSIVIDESTDLSTVKQLAIVAHYLNVDTASLEVRCLKLLDMSQYVRADAKGILSAVTEYLSNPGPDLPAIPLEKMAGAACDGAAVMLGRVNRVMTKLKEIVPQLVVTHCAAHRLALALSQSSQSEPWFKQMEKAINAVYVFFSRSTVHSAELSEMQKVMNKPTVRLQRPSDTRWLSLGNAVTALLKSFAAVKAVLENEAASGDVTAIGLVHQFKKTDVSRVPSSSL